MTDPIRRTLEQHLLRRPGGAEMNPNKIEEKARALGIPDV